MKKLLIKQLCLILIAFVTTVQLQGLYGQGVTTSSLSGSVTDAAGEPLIGANVVAIHVPSGTTPTVHRRILMVPLILPICGLEVHIRLPLRIPVMEIM